MMTPKSHSETTEKVAILHKTDLFGSLPDDLLRKIAGFAMVRTLHANQILCSEYEEATCLFVVAHGELRSIRQSRDGREQVLSTERPGAVLAAVPVFNGGKFFSTIIADTHSSVVAIEKHAVYHLCREHTELLWNVARVLAHKVRHFAELVESLALLNVEQRVAQHLLTIARERGIPATRGLVVELTLSRTQMASRLGTVREVVSRSLTHLQKSGLINIDGRRLVTIPDVKELTNFAGAEEHIQTAAQLASDLSSDLA